MPENETWLNIAPEYPEGGITSKVLFKGERNQTTIFYMGKGTNIGEHTSTKEGYVFVIEGDGVFVLEGEDIAMKPGVLIQMAANAVHSIRAVEDTAFLLVLNE